MVEVQAGCLQSWDLKMLGLCARVEGQTRTQKNKRGQLGSHTEKCIFIGYLPDYKGWKFYNPATKRTVISERAVFDERYFPGLKNWSAVPSYRSVPPTTGTPLILNSGLDEDALPAPPTLPMLPKPRLEGEEPAPAVENAPPALPLGVQVDSVPAPPPPSIPAPSVRPAVQPPPQACPMPPAPPHSLYCPHMIYPTPQ